jgi:hypothetical protein
MLGIVAVNDGNSFPAQEVKKGGRQDVNRRFAYPSLLRGDGNIPGGKHGNTEKRREEKRQAQGCTHRRKPFTLSLSTNLEV